jgi:hypothetical protein
MRKKNVYLLIVFSSDHMETFFLDNYSQMLLFIGESSSAKFVDKEVLVQNDTELALYLLYNLLNQGFDVYFLQEMKLDHPFASPLYWVLKTARNVRVIPLHVNRNVSPRVSPERYSQLGQAARRAVEEFDGDRRVTVYKTGGLFHYPGTPLYGKVDVEADQQIIRKIVEGKGLS